MSDQNKPASEEDKKPQASSSQIGSARKAKKARWTLERCQDKAKRFTSVDEWSKGSPSSYKAAVAHGWVKDCKKVFLKANVQSLTRINKKLTKAFKQSA